MRKEKDAKIDISFTVKKEDALDKLQLLRDVMFNKCGKTIASIAEAMDVMGNAYDGAKSEKLIAVSPIHTVRTHQFLAASFTITATSMSSFDLNIWTSIAEKYSTHMIVCAIGQDGTGANICAEAETKAFEKRRPPGAFLRRVAYNKEKRENYNYRETGTRPSHSNQRCFYA